MLSPKERVRKSFHENPILVTPPHLDNLASGVMLSTKSGLSTLAVKSMRAALGCALQMERPWAVSDGIRASRLYFRFPIFQATTAAMAGHARRIRPPSTQQWIQEKAMERAPKVCLLLRLPNSVSGLKFTFPF